MTEEQKELVDYEEEEALVAPKGTTKRIIRKTKKQTEVKKGHVGVHTTGFKDFLLKDELTRGIADCGFEHPSEVQQECIPQAILGGDVLCQAKSGMGKTAVFSIAILHQIKAEPGEVSALVLCHTRELAYQIRNEIGRLGKYMPDVKTAVFYGGVGIQNDEKTLVEEKPNVIVGTPGRILALIRNKKLSLSECKMFVLDECDKVLETIDMRRDVQEIFMKTPQKKQTMMFSATLSKETRAVCTKFMKTPLEIYVDNETKLTLHGLIQHYVKVEEKEKTKKLKEQLDELEFNQVVIFVKNVARAKALTGILVENGYPTVAIHSGLKQNDRIKIYKEFKDFQSRILVATDIFGRGMDVERVNVVFNYDMADNADSYLHRVGRAGRFGTKGLAITFVTTDEDMSVLSSIQDRFEVNITELPTSIPPSGYIGI